jgi:CheY-like chemotaxis protein
MMNGAIFMTSVPGRGSTFSVQLPQRKIGTGVLGKKMSEQLRNFDHSMRSMKIVQLVREPMPYGTVLIVDDLETNVFVARGLLAPYELSIDTASSGFEAIDKIQGGKLYDIVFMDHMMPKMDGVEATKILREQGYAGSIVALTANAVTGQAEMFLRNGFDGFLSKPIDLRQMNALLNRLVRDKQPPEVLEAARRHKGAANGNELRPGLDPQLAQTFIRDAEKSIAVLEAIYLNRCRRDDDMQMFVVNVHAMKSALASIGEQELSAVARSLEEAGRAENTAVMLGESPDFLKALRALIEKVTPREEDEGGETSAEKQACLRANLHAILAACATLDKRAAKKALAELQSKKWSRQTREQLETIAAHLLHSDFEEIAAIAERLLPGYSSQSRKSASKDHQPD